MILFIISHDILLSTSSFDEALTMLSKLGHETLVTFSKNIVSKLLLSVRRPVPLYILFYIFEFFRTTGQFRRNLA